MLKMLSMALILCPVGFFEEVITVFSVKMSQIDTENDKPKIFRISKILSIFFRIFDKLILWIGTLKRVNFERMCCPVDFSDEFIAVFN